MVNHEEGAAPGPTGVGQASVVRLLSAGAKGTERVAHAAGVDRALNVAAEEAIVCALRSPTVLRALERAIESNDLTEAWGSDEIARLVKRLLASDAAGQARTEFLESEQAQMLVERDRGRSRDPGRDRFAERRVDHRHRRPPHDHHRRTRRCPGAGRPPTGSRFRDRSGRARHSGCGCGHRFGAAVRRLVLASILSLLPLALGYLAILRDPRRRAWSDRMTGTEVIYDVVARAAPHAGGTPVSAAAARHRSRPTGA